MESWFYCFVLLLLLLGRVMSFLLPQQPVSTFLFLLFLFFCLTPHQFRSILRSSLLCNSQLFCFLFDSLCASGWRFIPSVSFCVFFFFFFCDFLCVRVVLLSQRSCMCVCWTTTTTTTTSKRRRRNQDPNSNCNRWRQNRVVEWCVCFSFRVCV